MNLSTMRVLGMKSHDFHIWIERILPAMVRGYVPEHVWLALSELSYFFRQLCAKEYDEVQNDNDLVILEGNDEVASSDGVEIEMVDSDDESYDPANPDTYEDYF